MSSGVRLNSDKVKTININYKSDVDNKSYVGSFTTKKLSIADLAALGVRKAQLNGGFHHDSSKPGQGVDSETDNFNSMIAHLELALVDKPSWWDLSEITDVQVMVKVYEEVISFENSFLDRVGDSSSEGGSRLGDGREGSSQASGQEQDRHGARPEVVGQEVQSSLEP